MSAVPKEVPEPPTGKASMLALVVDDQPSERMLLEACLLEEGLEVVHAENGEKAIEACNRRAPDIILMDTHMPGMGGIEATKAIRKLLGEDYVPIIFFNELDSSRQLLSCMKAGGDDFVIKPFNPTLLSVKVHSHIRIRNTYKTQQAQYHELKAHQVSTKIEQEFASSLNKKIVESGFVESPNVKFDLSPMAMFNGDILLCAYTPSNKMHLLLGDFTGHGISASVAAAPASEIFYGMTNKGFGIVEIAEEINQKLVRLLPANMFLATTILCLDRENSNLSLITCGLPDHFLYSRSRNQAQTIHSANLPLGIIPQPDLGAKLLQFKINDDDHLILFSDGVIESENSDGEAFGFEGVQSGLTPDQPCLDSILQALSEHRKDLPQQDDITLVEVICDLAPERWQRQQNADQLSTLPPTRWKQTYRFNSDTLKRLNPVPMAVNALMETQGLHPFRESIFLVVTELFVNALEHGLLELDSEIKATPEGFADFFDLRSRRLEELVEGSIDMEFEHQPTSEGGLLSILVRDTGKGFSPESYHQQTEDKQTHYHGRGLNLIEKICESLDYSDNGRCARALFRWSSSTD